LRLGSLLTYASALDAGKASAARGQVDPRTLCGPFRFRSVGEGTGVFAVAGTMVFSSGLAQALNEALAEAGIDAVFVPFAVDSLPEFMSFADDLRIRGAAICSPYRFDASAYCSWIDRAARSSGAVTFIRKYSGGWKGFDLDSLCIDQAIKLVLGRRWRPLLRGVVAGSGALAQAAVDALRARRVRVLVTDRSLTASASGRRRPGVRWTGPDSQGLSPKSIGHTLFVKASLASEEAQEDDPVPGYFFSGRETALDLAREGPRSRFAQRAAEASCRVEDATEFVGFQSARILRLVAGEEGA
jgi:shikimate 5-dehydrogenase